MTAPALATRIPGQCLQSRWLLLCVITCIVGFSNGFSTHSAIASYKSVPSLSSSAVWLENEINNVNTNGIMDETNNEDEDDVTPYMDRSLGWTKRYRRLVPYEAARRTAMKLGLRSQEEWEDIREFGKAFHGAHSVSRPDLMYAKEWISWDEFLGVMRPYESAKDMVQNQLQLRSMEEYIAFVKEDTKRAEDLRIPAKPEIVYREKGWTGEEDFFGT